MVKKKTKSGKQLLIRLPEDVMTALKNDAERGRRSYTKHVERILVDVYGLELSGSKDTKRPTRSLSTVGTGHGKGTTVFINPRIAGILEELVKRKKNSIEEEVSELILFSLVMKGFLSDEITADHRNYLLSRLSLITRNRKPAEKREITKRETA